MTLVLRMGIVTLFGLIIRLEPLCQVHHPIRHSYLEPGPQDDKEKEFDDEEYEHNKAIVIAHIVVHDLFNLGRKGTINIDFLSHDDCQVAVAAAVLKLDLSGDTCLHKMIVR